MIIILGLTVALMAAQPAGNAVPDGYLYFVNVHPQVVHLQVDGKAAAELNSRQIVGYPIARGPHDLRITAGNQSVATHADLDVADVAQDAMGRRHWCFAAAANDDGSLNVIAFESKACAELITTGE